MAAAELTRGTLVAGKYRVDRVVGEGGFGVVVAAEHLGLGRKVALKVLRIEADEGLVERFQREARAAAGLSSPHVPQVFDIDRLPSGEPYIVMELLEGLDLGQLLRRQGTLRVGDALEYVRQACHAVAEAHAMGIVHRDLKPANLFLARDAQSGSIVKVLDFGLAKLASDLQSPRQVALTRTGSFFGSPAYMAPEQWISPRAADARSDIWSLGCVLYELLTARLPFEQDNLADLFRLTVESDAPSPRAHRQDISPALEALVLRCLQKDPARRFANGGELAASLRALVAAEGPSVAVGAGGVGEGFGQASPTAFAPTVVGTLSPGAAGVPRHEALHASEPSPPPGFGRPGGVQPSGASLAHAATAHASSTHPSHGAFAVGRSEAYRQTVTASASRRAGGRRSRWIVGALLAFGSLAAVVAVLVFVFRERIQQGGLDSAGAGDESAETDPDDDTDVEDGDPSTEDALAESFAAFARGLGLVGNPSQLLIVTVASTSVSFTVPAPASGGQAHVYTFTGGRPFDMPIDGASFRAMRPFHPSAVDRHVLDAIVRQSLRDVGNPPRASVTATLSAVGKQPLLWTVTINREGEPIGVWLYDERGALTRRTQ